MKSEFAFKDLGRWPLLRRAACTSSDSGAGSRLRLQSDFRAEGHRPRCGSRRCSRTDKVRVDRRDQHADAAAERSSAAYGSGRCTQPFWACRHRIERALIAAAASSSCSVHIWSLSPAALTWCCRRREAADPDADRSLRDYARDEPVTRSDRSASELFIMFCPRDISPGPSRENMLPIGPCRPGNVRAAPARPARRAT